MLRNRPLLVAVLGAVVLAVMIGTAAATVQHRPAVSVSPAVGGSHSRFMVAFRAPIAAGRTAGQASSYVISASTRSSSGCRSAVTRRLGFAHRGQAERVALAAPGSGGLCAGTYHGTVTLVRAPVCGPALACPLYVVLAHRVGSFRFRVR
ncbi:MAG: hypothetical protein QOH52_2821 [Pseudonocardiales bacterium]|nr:hypothetical protein [Pseudonocardiales bacterium]MEA2145643.1 hypothetical protein [Solirubrobacteraceae bacterium]